MSHHTDIFVGIDVAKSRNAIAIADHERGGEVRYFGEVDASPDTMRRVVQRIVERHRRAHFCYEAGPTGYGLHRMITAMGHPSDVVALPDELALSFDAWSSESSASAMPVRC